MNFDALAIVSAIVSAIGASAILTLIMDTLARYVMRADCKHVSQLRRSLGVMEGRK